MAYEPVVKPFGVNVEKGIVLECPFKFFISGFIPELNSACIKHKCALWLPIQRACAIQVLARGFEPKFRRKK